MFRYIIWAIVIFSLIRFVINFLIPVFRATRQMKQQVRDFQGRMDGQGNFQGAQDAPDNRSHAEQKAAKPKSGDYIDFEEIR